MLCVVSLFFDSCKLCGYPYIFRPTINPFEYIDVKFEGIDGQGSATVELVKTNGHVKSLEDLCVSISKTYQLSENEVIVISTNPFEATCWHSQTSKEYTVKGLSFSLPTLMTLTKMQKR